MMTEFNNLKEDAIKTAVALMAASARTAPKSKGRDDIKIKYFDGKEFAKAIRYMGSDEFKKETRLKGEFFLDSDIEVLKEAEGVLAIGVESRNSMMMNCKKCGFENCAEFKKARNSGREVNCIFKVLDLGFATCSACKIAADLNIDNRVMYDIGEAIRRLYMKDCDIVLGIAISVKGNNIFVDRYLRFFVHKAREEKKSVDKLLKDYGIKV